MSWRERSELSARSSFRYLVESTRVFAGWVIVATKAAGKTVAMGDCRFASDYSVAVVEAAVAGTAGRRNCPVGILVRDSDLAFHWEQSCARCQVVGCWAAG